MYNYSVEPMEYTRGYCATKCETLEQAINVYDQLTEYASEVAWVIMPLNEQADKYMHEFFTYEPTLEELVC